MLVSAAKKPRVHKRKDFAFRVSVSEMHRIEEYQRRLRNLEPDELPPSRTTAINHAVRVALGEAEAAAHELRNERAIAEINMTMALAETLRQEGGTDAQASALFDTLRERVAAHGRR